MHFSAMKATGPTARPAHSTLHFGEGLRDANTPRLHFFAGRHPADPLISRERGNVLPQSFHLRR